MARERPRHHPEPVQAQAALDARGEALSVLLKEVLQPFEPSMGAAMNEVVVTIRPQQVVEVGTRLRDDPRTACDYLMCLSVVDYQDRFELVYIPYSMQKSHRFMVKTSVPYDDPRLPSVISVWPGADWYEREGHDLFGVVFDGHPNLAPLILYEGFEGYPGRKSYPFNDYQEW